MTLHSTLYHLNLQGGNLLPQTSRKGNNLMINNLVASSSSSSTPSSTQQEKSEKAQFIETLIPDNTPEEPNVWCEIMKLTGTKRNNQISDGYCQWLNKNYESGIHEVLSQIHFISPTKNKTFLYKCTLQLP